MKQLSLAIVLLFTIFISSCVKVVGDGPIITQQRSVGTFTGITSSISGKVNFTVAPDYKVEVKAQHNILDVLETYKIGDELFIRVKSGTIIKTNHPVEVNISGPRLNLVKCSGSGDISVYGQLAETVLDLHVSGSGSIYAQDLSVSDKLYASVSGSGTITALSGVAKNEELHISGSGGLDLIGVKSENSNTHISGSGNIKVDVSKRLDARISGSGSVYYRGNPIISSNVSGSGRVRPM